MSLTVCLLSPYADWNSSGSRYSNGFWPSLNRPTKILLVRWVVSCSEFSSFLFFVPLDSEHFVDLSETSKTNLSSFENASSNSSKRFKKTKRFKISCFLFMFHFTVYLKNCVLFICRMSIQKNTGECDSPVENVATSAALRQFRKVWLPTKKARCSALTHICQNICCYRLNGKHFWRKK